MVAWKSVITLAAQQHGVVSREQLLAAGVTRSTIPRMVTERGWTRAHPGVYRLPGHPATFAQKAQAALLALPVDGIVTSAAAAHLHGLRQPPAVIELLIGEHQHVRAPAGARLRRTRTLVPSDVSHVAGLPCATGARMLIDYAATASVPQLRALLIDTAQRRLVRYEDLGDRVRQLGPVRGKGVLRQLVWELDAERCDSVLEHRVRTLIRDAGLPAPHSQPVEVRTPGRTLHVDIGWPRRRVGIEVDGFAFHSTRSDLDRDQRRLNALMLAGWKVLRVGWDRVEQDPEAFAREVRMMLA